MLIKNLYIAVINSRLGGMTK